MKWFFGNRLKMLRNTTDKKPCKIPRKRFKRPRLTDLFCLLRSPGMLQESFSSHSQLSGKYSSSWELSLFHSHRSQDSNDSLASPMQHKVPESKPLEHTSPEHSTHEDHYLIRQPAFCPNCQNVVMILPQKRSAHPLETGYGKRMRPSIDFDRMLASTLPSTDRSSQPSPIYESIDESIDFSKRSLCTTQSPLTADVTAFDSAALETFQGHTAGSVCMSDAVTDPTVVVSSGLAQFAHRTLPDIPITPCVVSSTLKRRFSGSDDSTVYDDVASEPEDNGGDDDDTFFEIREYVFRSRSPIRLKTRKLLTDRSPAQSARPAKHLHREYFVCEE